MPRLDTITWVRIGAGAFVVAAIALGAAQSGRKEEGSSVVAAPLIDATRDPLGPELERCNALTPADGRDAACERVWEENRRRFLGMPTEARP